MITANAVVDAGRCLVELDVNGHAEFNKTGEDIICSAVSILTRTTGRMVLSQLHEYCESSSDEKGTFRVKIRKIPDGKRDWMKGVTEFLLNGLSDLNEDYPAYIKLEITINEE